MKEIKKYTDIVRYGKTITQGVLNEGDIISITEKIDGANASFCRDVENVIGVACFSRRQEVNEGNTLRGYYKWITENIAPNTELLNPNYRYFGEWLCSHKVAYKPECYKNFYLFSIWNEELSRYESDEIVQSEAVRLGLTTAPYIYQGPFISFDHLMQFVGKSDLSLEPNTGEGIVVKNVNYFDRYGSQCFVKLVTEKFAEVQKQRLPKNPNVNQPIVDSVRAVLTEARVEKLILKLVDDGKLHEDYTIEDMGTILKQLGSDVFDDIMKEEADLLAEFETDMIRRTIGKNVPPVIRAVLRNQNRD